MQQQLVSDKVSIVLGSYGSGVSIAASDIFKDGGVPALGISCTNPQITQGNTHYFRICFLDPFQGTVLANFAKDNFSAKKAYVLTKLGDDYSAGLGHYFSKAFEELGGECVEETFSDGNSDFASYITSAKNSGADVVFAPTSTEAAALIIEQAASQGLETPILASDTWDSNVILKAAKGKNLQIYVTTFYQEGGNEEFDKGIKEYINSDSTAKSTDPAKVNEALWDVTYDGVCGHVEFDENGDAKRDTAFIKSLNAEKGSWDLVGEQGIDAEK